MIESMRHPGLSVLLLLPALFVPSVYGQNSPASRFAGVWEARSGERVVCTFRIESGTSIKAWDLGCRISVDKEGNLMDPGPFELSEGSPLSNVALRDGVLYFQIDPGPEEQEPIVIRGQLKLTGEREAELTFLDFPSR